MEKIVPINPFKSTDVVLSNSDNDILQKLGELGQKVISTFNDLKVSCEDSHVSYDNNLHSNDGVTGQISSQEITRKLVPLSKWNLKFTGDNSFSVNAFLERVNELRDARNASDDDLWRGAVDLFEGNALIWYRANRKYASNWCELSYLLKKAFQRHDYEDYLLDRIKSRKQSSSPRTSVDSERVFNYFVKLSVISFLK